MCVPDAWIKRMGCFVAERWGDTNTGYRDPPTFWTDNREGAEEMRETIYGCCSVESRD